jgi:hypothetical protein
VLLQHQPCTAAAVDSNGQLPLQLALSQAAHSARHREAAACLLRSAAGHCITDLTALRAARPAAQPLFTDFVIARAPLTPVEWDLSPAPCPGLLKALPAALSWTCEQARQLVVHASAADVQRLRTALLCLQRTERRQGLRVPMALMSDILGLCFHH